jgi:putative transposase
MSEKRSSRWTWHDSEQIIEKLGQVDDALKRGVSLLEAVDAVGVSYATYRRWKKHYGGMTLHQLRWTRNLESENNRMRQVLAQMDAHYPFTSLNEIKPA